MGADHHEAACASETGSADCLVRKTAVCQKDSSGREACNGSFSPPIGPSIGPQFDVLTGCRATCASGA